MDKVKTFEYDGTPVKFSTDNESFVMVNATEMAKKFGTEPKYWLRNDSSQRFVKSLAEVRKCRTADYQILIFH